MAGYTKLFQRILDSTIWREDDDTRILWITMLALADQDGVVQCTIPGLADRARITLQQCLSGLLKFQEPDEYSWSKTAEGRRITEVEGGWYLINHAKYRALMSAEEQREKTRLRVAKWRENHKTVTVTKCNAGNDIAEADTKAKEETIPPTVTEESFTLDAAVSFVLIETGLAGRNMREVVHQVIHREIKKNGVGPKDSAEAMIEAWRKYDLMEVSFKLGPEKFFGSGLWRKPESQWSNDKPGNFLPPQNVSADYIPESVKRKNELAARKAQGL